MPFPDTGGQLQLFLCAMQWLRSAIPNFPALVHDLHGLLERVYSHVGKHTKWTVSCVPLASLGWQQKHTAAFQECNNTIINRTTLFHRDESKSLYIFTDASASHWSGIVPHVPCNQPKLHHAEKAHNPLAFHSRRFPKTSRGWATL